MCELTEDEYCICIHAILKCHQINSYVKSGLPVTVTNKNFAFTEMSNKEVFALTEKLKRAADLAWLKDTKPMEL